MDNIGRMDVIVLQCVVDYGDVQKTGAAQRCSPLCVWKTVFFMTSETLVACTSIAHVNSTDL